MYNGQTGNEFTLYMYMYMCVHARTGSYPEMSAQTLYSIIQ